MHIISSGARAACDAGNPSYLTSPRWSWEESCLCPHLKTIWEKPSHPWFKDLVGKTEELSVDPLWSQGDQRVTPRHPDSMPLPWDYTTGGERFNSLTPSAISCKKCVQFRIVLWNLQWLWWTSFPSPLPYSPWSFSSSSLLSFSSGAQGWKNIFANYWLKVMYHHQLWYHNSKFKVLSATSQTKIQSKLRKQAISAKGRAVTQFLANKEGCVTNPQNFLNFYLFIQSILKSFFQLCWCQRPAGFPPGPAR